MERDLWSLVLASGRQGGAGFAARWSSMDKMVESGEVGCRASPPLPNGSRLSTLDSRASWVPDAASCDRTCVSECACQSVTCV